MALIGLVGAAPRTPRRHRHGTRRARRRRAARGRRRIVAFQQGCFPNHDTFDQLLTTHRPPPASVASRRCQLPDVVTLAAAADRVARLCELFDAVALNDAMSPQERS